MNNPDAISYLQISKRSRNIMYLTEIYIIAAVLLISGVGKIINPIPLIETFKAFTSLSEEIIISTATFMIFLEIGLGLLLFLKIKLKLVLISTLLLFSAFPGFSIYGPIVGLTNDCGCFGSLVKSQIGVGMIIRNSLLFLIMLALYKNNNNGIVTN